MQLRGLNPLLALSLSLFFSACSGGSAGDPSRIRQDCGSGDTTLFCLTSCNLGCALSGCSINQIHQNEPVVLNFSEDVDEFSVPPHTASIRLATSTGEEPWGDWIVEGSRVTFVPGVLLLGASTFFGFTPNQTYTLHLPAGPDAPDVVRSASSDRLTTSITCTLNISGIKDLNQVPPSARLITPGNTNGSPLDTKIVLEFNEILDPAAFNDITELTTPIRYSVKSTQVVAGATVCATATKAVVLPGVPKMRINQSRGTSVVTFAPKEALPGNKCVEVEVTSKVRDLAGVPAATQVFTFTTDNVPTPVQSRVEDFTTTQFLDPQRSAGTWGNGRLTFSPIGGSGIHGVFNPADGRKVSGAAKTVVYEWDTDGMTVSKNTSNPMTVSDGQFFFDSFDLPDGVVVNFVGANPARIWVRGSATIGGVLTANGKSLVLGGFSEGQKLGEKGGGGGAFGSGGGAGGDQCDGKGAKPAFNGKPGADVNLRNGHAWAGNRANTGGRGSVLFPASGLTSAIVYTASGVISVQMNRGGGGGGFVAGGGTGQVIFPRYKNMGLLAPGLTAGGKGTPFPATFPNTPGFTPADHFLVGGSGGGGGGSCCSAAIKSTPSSQIYRAGRAGAGGGGALGMRIGGSLIVKRSGRIEARGGSAPLEVESFGARFLPTPGGAGAGGSLFLQVNLDVDNTGSISVKGGAGGRNRPTDAIFNGADAWGGDGSNGLLQFQTTQAVGGYKIGTTVPAAPTIANIIPGDEDDLVTVRSLWYPASLLFPPDFLRYEIKAIVDGKETIFSDDPSKGKIANGTPLRFFVQGAELETGPSGQLAPKPNTKIFAFTPFVGPFSTNPNQRSLFGTGSTGYRFELTLDRSMKNIVDVKSITVFWKL